MTSPHHPRHWLHRTLTAVRSKRTRAVMLLSFSSGIPLGLVWYAIPDWLSTLNVDNRIIGLSTLAHAPWTFKMLWSPFMDRYAPRWLGRRRGWIALSQIALLLLTLSLSGVGDHPDTPWVVLALALAIAFASASQDIVIDAYTVEVLRPDEQGVAVGARTAMYRAAMLVAGALSITLAGMFSWALVNAALALLYLPLLLVTLTIPDPETPIVAPRRLREAVWLPFLGFLSRHRALEILSFVLLYKLADNLAQSLQRPFLQQMGYDSFDRGVAMGTVGVISMICGTFLGGALTPVLGLGRCLWIFGLLQIVSNLGYVLLAYSAVNRPLMYAAIGFESLTTGTGMGAFSVLLLRLTQKRFSATQYALFSSLFALPRMIAGPITGFVVHAVGWATFFWFTMIAGIPGLLFLTRFAPFRERDPRFTVEPPRARAPLSTGQLLGRGLLGGLAGAGSALVLMAALDALGTLSGAETARIGIGAALIRLLAPSTVGEFLQLLGALVFGLICALMTAAVFAARHGEPIDCGPEEA